MPFQDLGGWNDWRWVVFKDPETRRKGLTPEQRKKIIEFVSEAGKLDGVLGWYMADEPECRDNNPVWYEEARELIAEIDPYHPCFMLNWGTGGMRRYYKGCDILLPDCYPQYFEDGTTSKKPLGTFGICQGLHFAPPRMADAAYDLMAGAFPRWKNTGNPSDLS